MADKEPVRAYKEWVSGLYARAAESYDQTGPRAFSHWGRRLVELAQIRAGETVVDVGMGRGQELFPAADRVGSRGRVVGIDFCQEMVRLTAAEISRRGLPNAGVCLMDAEELAFADAQGGL